MWGIMVGKDDPTLFCYATETFHVLLYACDIYTCLDTLILES